METPNYPPDAPAPKKSNTPIIIAIVVVVLLCCCCIMGIAGWWLFQNGDSLTGGTSMALQHIL
jgi:flagellar basal body-associated protein FliL